MNTILIIEDDKDIAALEADYLSANGYITKVAFRGDEGISLALNGDFDLIIVDVMLPGNDGYEVLKEIREKKNIPVIMVTSKQETVDKIRGLGLGADDYIVKPFDPSELVARVTAHLRRYDRLTSGTDAEKIKQNENWLDYGRLKIGLQSYRVMVDDVEVRFTNKEFELLKFLATNPNIVFSKESLFDRIWGMDSLGDTATVTVHINRIREKTEKDPSNPEYIQTVWGAGYRFSAR